VARRLREASRGLRVTWKWITEHFADLMIGTFTTVLGVWLAYRLTIQHDLEQLKADQDQIAIEARNAEEATARSVLQEFVTNYGIAGTNYAILNNERKHAASKKIGLVALEELYEGTSPTLNGQLPRVFQSPDSIRHRIKSIMMTTHALNARIRFREQYKLANISQTMTPAQWETYFQNLRTLDEDLLYSLRGYSDLLLQPDTIWRMPTWPDSSSE